jgi:hypothetical protein
VFINEGKSLVIRLFVNNIIIAAKTLKAVNEFKRAFGAVHKIKDLGEIHQLLRLTITRDCTKKRLWISREGFTQKLVDEYLSLGDYCGGVPWSPIKIT